MKEEKKLKCEYCGKYVANDKKGLATHRRFSKECLNKWLEEEKIKDSKRTKVKCEICKCELRNISNTHLKKHNVTQAEYKEKFPDSPIFSEGLLITQRENREKTISEKYTDEEIKFLKGTKSRESIIKKYGKIRTFKDTKTEAEIKKMCNDMKIRRNNFISKLKEDNLFDSYVEKSNKKREQTNLISYGVEFPQKLKITKDKQKQTLIENYGSLDEAYKEISKKGMSSRKEKYGIYFHYCPTFSMESQLLFVELDKFLNNYTTYYATKKYTKYAMTGEYQVKVDSKKCSVRYLDFYVKELNKYIEFDEDFHKYRTSDDIERENEITESINAKSIRITKKEFLKDKEKTIKKCIDFLMV